MHTKDLSYFGRTKITNLIASSIRVDRIPFYSFMHLLLPDLCEEPFYLCEKSGQVP